MAPASGSTDETCQRVYCTHDRLREGKAAVDGQKRIFDPGEKPRIRPPLSSSPFVSLKKVLLLIEISSATKEFLKAKFDCTHVMAWTIVPASTDESDTLQFCPWFLDYAMKQKNQFQSQWKPGKMASLISSLKLDRLATWAFYTPIDLFQLFDKVIVHEVRTQPSGTSAMHN